MKAIICKSCGGILVDGRQKYDHIKRCRNYKKEGIDHLVCKVCGYKSPVLSKHLRMHDMTREEYLEKYPGSELVLRSITEKQSNSNIGKHVVKIEDRSGAIFCDKCGEWYLKRFNAKHLKECVGSHPDKYIEGKDYVRCPECGEVFSSLGQHLKKEHGWDNDRLILEKGRGLRLIASDITERKLSHQDMEATKEKRRKTNMDRYGVENVSKLKESGKKAVETSMRRYGRSHAMKTSEVMIRQNRSAQRGPSGQEIFFDENTCDNVVYCGYGGRFIRTKTGVHKYGRLIKDLNPDFIVLSDRVLESALRASRDRCKMDRQKHRSRYVVELLGDWYHSEEVIGVDRDMHEREIIEAYRSAGIDCLVLWESDVMGCWDKIKSGVMEWIEGAVMDSNKNPVY